MRYIPYILLLISLVACSQKETKKLPNLINNPVEDTIAKPIEKEEIINPAFLELVKHIDSVGYINDTNLFNKTYNQDYTLRKCIEYYYFYLYNFENTTLFNEYSYQLEWRTEINANTKKEDILDIALFEKVTNVISYHYINKNGNGYFCDGIIELWSFPKSNDAKLAAENLSLHESYLFTNRGAYVCYKKNNMYIFHSRSAGFYTPLKNFINYFETTTNVIIPNKDIQRKTY